MGYKYYIDRCNEEYYFALFPNNSNVFEVGRSEAFSTLKSCQDALDKFRKCGALFRSDPSSYEIIKKETGRFQFRFYYDNHVFYQDRGHGSKFECKKGIERVIKNIDAPLKTR